MGVHLGILRANPMPKHSMGLEHMPVHKIFKVPMECLGCSISLYCVSPYCSTKEDPARKSVAWDPGFVRWYQVP